ncbi:1-acyl-sn-glycerol-3-phosphate acyltransferase, partial [Candidatus Sumerlaeota bacterium]|nr:1-acyl-sn-glycerol-3-phosphate acyltransferase [Candidatus Sumerlaeota bacterium]
MLYYLCKILLLLIARPFFRARARGVEKIPVKKAILFVSNHASFLDPPLIGMFVPGRVYYMGKKELFDNRLFGWFLGQLGTIPIRRTGLDREGIRICRDILKSGKSLLVFPEGTRTPDGNLREMKRGIALLTQEIPEIDLMPVYIDGTFKAWPRGRKIPKPAKVSVFFGDSFKISQKGVAM